MKILSLNCHGLQNAPTVHALSDVRRRYNPDVMFLSETHLDDFPADCYHMKLQMDCKIVNPSNGRSGGVLIFWKEIKLQQIFSAPKYIDVHISESNDKVWRLA
jgi:exonuclease III